MPGPRRFLRTVTFTRPSNTTQYSVNDAVSDNATTPTAATFVLPSVSPAIGLGGLIKSVYLFKSDQDQTGADFNLYLFDTQPAAAGYEDNALIAITDAEWATCVGFVALVATSDAASVDVGDAYHKTNLDWPFECVAGSTSLYSVLVARGTYTPASAEVFTIRIGGEVN